MSYYVEKSKHEGMAIPSGIPAQMMHAALHEAILGTRIYPATEDPITVERFQKNLTGNLKHDVDSPNLQGVIEACIRAYSVQMPETAATISLKAAAGDSVAIELGVGNGEENLQFMNALHRNLRAAGKAVKKEYCTVPCHS